MRISIRRCLSMLRNTVYGNELTLPPMPSKEHCVGYWYTVRYWLVAAGYYLLLAVTLIA